MMTSLLFLPACLLALTQFAVISADNWILDPSTGKEYLVMNVTTLVNDVVTDLCAEQNAILPEPRSEAENQFLVDLEGELSPLGMNDDEVEGTWVWNSDGSPVVFNNFESGEGTDGAAENCALLGRHVGNKAKPLDEWHDYKCESDQWLEEQTSAPKRLICERVHCPEGWTLGFNSCYKRYKKKGYKKARELCAEEGAQLIGPDYDRDFLMKTLGLKGRQSVWLSNGEVCKFVHLGKNEVKENDRCGNGHQIVCMLKSNI